jgi:hypothetical protein
MNEPSGTCLEPSTHDVLCLEKFSDFEISDKGYRTVPTVQHLHHHENLTSCCAASLWLEEQLQDSMWEMFSYVERNSAAVRNRSQKSAEKVK